VGGVGPTLFINTYAALIAASLPNLVVLLLLPLVTRMVVLCRMRSRRRGHQLLLLNVMGMHAAQMVVDHRRFLLAERADAAVPDVVPIAIPLILGNLSGYRLAGLYKVRNSGPQAAVVGIICRKISLVIMVDIFFLNYYPLYTKEVLARRNFIYICILEKTERRDLDLTIFLIIFALVRFTARQFDTGLQIDIIVVRLKEK